MPIKQTKLPITTTTITKEKIKSRHYLLAMKQNHMTRYKKRIKSDERLPLQNNFFLLFVYDISCIRLVFCNLSFDIRSIVYGL